MPTGVISLVSPSIVLSSVTTAIGHLTLILVCSRLSIGLDKLATPVSRSVIYGKILFCPPADCINYWIYINKKILSDFIENCKHNTGIFWILIFEGFRDDIV